MLGTNTGTYQRWLDDESQVHERLNRLIAANLDEAARRHLFRRPDDEEQVRLMRRPIPTERAYALFGLLLGTLPPAAIFYRLYDYAVPQNSQESHGLFFLFVLMNSLCLMMGKVMGERAGRGMDQIERQTWSMMLLRSALRGVWWALATGAVGGAVVVGIGALFGALLAVPVGVVAFSLFTILHRLVKRDGMIDARHFWPLACGVTATIGALILGF